MEYNSIDEVIEGFAIKEKVLIDYGDATDEEISELSEILRDTTRCKPFDGASFEAYMHHYRESYPLLSSDGNSVSSYTRDSHASRTHDVLTVTQVLELVNKHEYSEDDFESVF